MAQVRAFRAVRYDEQRAGPLDLLVAPPFDVISAEERERLLERSRCNVVRLTLPDSEDDAGRLWTQWLGDGILVREQAAGLWWLEQEYVGPDGVARTRRGLVCSLRAEPYESGVVLPHERTHRGPKEGRLRLLRATRAQLEPILLLYEGALEAPGGEPLAEVELDGVRNRVGRFPGDPPAELADARLLIADGHHRYETTLAFHEEDGFEESAWLLAVVVPTRQEGLTIFPTHRVVEHVGRELAQTPDGDVRAALAAIQREPRERAAAVVYRRGSVGIVHGRAGELDPELVERHEPRGVSYTPRLEDAVQAVDDGRAEAAFLLRPPTIEEVAAVARGGGTMPQKSTYFYPKLPSGLLFHPLDA